MNRILGLPLGYRDLVFGEARARRAIEQRLAEILEQAGYGEIMPSTLEYLELYQRGKQSIADRTIKLIDRNDDLLALRADFTPSIARIVGERLQAAPMPARIWYAGNVFRRVDAHRGHWCEFGQIGAELVGGEGAVYDAEVITLAFRMMESLNIKDVECHLNHTGVFRGIVEELGLAPDALDHVKAEIDHKDPRGLAVRLESLGVSRELREQLRVLSRCIGGREVLAEARRHIRNDVSGQALDELDRLAATLSGWGDRLVLDLTEIDEMEYYTGVMFTFFTPRLSDELGTGGRYDGLYAEYGQARPAIGFSLSTDGLMDLL